MDHEQPPPSPVAVMLVLFVLKHKQASAPDILQYLSNRAYANGWSHMYAVQGLKQFVKSGFGPAELRALEHGLSDALASYTPQTVVQKVVQTLRGLFNRCLRSSTSDKRAQESRI